MEFLSGLGLVSAVVAFGVVLLGFVALVSGARDTRRLMIGLRTVYLGVAVASVGLAVFTLFRPSESMTVPIRLFVVLVAGLTTLRFAVAAFRLEIPHRGQA